MSPRTKEQNSQIKDDRREQILMAALKLFAKRGLAATKISDIAKSANFSHGLVYHYFQSKEEVFIELVSRAVELSAASLQTVDALPIGAIDKIRTITDYVVKSIYETEESAFYFLLMVQAAVSDANPEAVKEIIQNAFEPNEIMIKIVEEGQKKGIIHEGSPHDYTTLYWSTIQGLALAKIAAGEDFNMPNVDLLIRMFEK